VDEERRSQFSSEFRNPETNLLSFPKISGLKFLNY
jgi:hypothetical protein